MVAQEDDYVTAYMLAEASPEVTAIASLPLPVWILVVCAVIAALSLFVLLVVSSRYVAANRSVIREVKNLSAEVHRWSEIAQRQTELNNAPLLKVVHIEEVTTDQGRGTRIDVKNVGFGSAVNVKCILTDHNDKEYVSPQTEIVGNETASFEPPLLIESVKNLRLEYLSQGGSYAHTTQYVIKSGGQSYALHRVR
jgi:hypothetical protein